MAIYNLIKPHELLYQGKTALGTQVYEYKFKSVEPVTWKAGQYGIFEIPLKNGKTARRSFSISSAPNEHLIKISTRIPSSEPSPFKKGLKSLKKDTPVKLRGIFGPMHIEDTTKQYAFITTGLGIAPLKAILEQLVFDEIYSIKITLFYLSGSGEHLYKEDLSKIKQSLNNFNILYIYKPDRITGQLIEDELGKDLLDYIYFLSGSKPAVKGFKRTLIGLKINKDNIKHNPSYLAKPNISKAYITDKIKKL